MRIAQIAPLIECVPPRGYGGIELVVSLLTDELVKNGHEVTLFASGDSVTTARLCSAVPRALRLDSKIKIHQWPSYELQNILYFLERQNEFDVVHSHLGWQLLPFLSSLAIPSVTTAHCNVEREHEPIYRRFAHLPYVAISNSFRARNLPSQMNYVRTVHNGIDVSTFAFDPAASRDYLLFLGRISHDKGTAEAIKIASRLGLPLKIAGKVDPTDTHYFDSCVKPLLGSCDVELVGEVDTSEKVELFRNAIALIYPINFDEPFGLVMAESLACGVPALALRRGSVCEVLSDGETAIIEDTIDGLIERFPEVYGISRQSCRLRAEALFSKERMTAGYEAVYEQITRQAEREVASDVAPAKPEREVEIDVVPAGEPMLV